ncbi:disulfide bond formation protein DsbB [Caulobacter ginsengisoli]|uniref:Disulfide bond formation protein DsbB n=1 Tax=Caulobacter ginsengisoli TaxID=400775 RepID=A0ABU0IWW3_9CAUL|nr:disulfide bond formation protein B [Caulobacter ginsengisoli]MDQ0465855.1 disulfide bond formation protein DsbB [Caulobacter ginsengisoli]
MKRLVDIILKNWLLTALLVSAAMLAIAHGFETFAGLSPCTLCFKQREVYWTAGFLAAAGLVVERIPAGKRFAWLFSLILAAVFAYGLYLAVYHAGAEWKFWPGPAACASGGGHVSMDDLTKMLGKNNIKAPACDQAAWVFAGLSMAGWNALISLGLIVASVLAALRARKAA